MKWLKKCKCALVSTHDWLVAVGLAVLTSVVGWHLGQYYGWNGSGHGWPRGFVVFFALVGFVISALCIASVPFNRVNDARLAVASIFVSYAYLGALVVPGLSGSDRLSRVALYMTVAVVAGAHLVEDDIKDLEKKL